MIENYFDSGIGVLKLSWKSKSSHNYIILSLGGPKIYRLKFESKAFSDERFGRVWR